MGKKSGDTWIFPHGLRFTIPPPYPYENHAPLEFSCSEHSWLGYLIKMFVYMMPQFNICHMSRYTISDNSKSETQHNQIEGGALAFSSAP